MSVKVSSLVWDSSPYAESALLVHLALADWCDDDGMCFPSQAKIAAKARVSERWVRELMKRMAADGYLEVLSEPKRGVSRRYRLTFPEVSSPQLGCPEETSPELSSPQLANDRNSTTQMTGTPASREPSLEPSVRTPVDAGASGVTTISNQHAKVVADAIYEHTNGMGNYQAIRQVAVKAVKKFTPEQIIRAMKNAHDDGRPLTGAVVDQYLTGKVKSRQVSQSALGFNGMKEAPW